MSESNKCCEKCLLRIGDGPCMFTGCPCHSTTPDTEWEKNSDKLGELLYKELVDIIGKEYVVVSIGDGEDADVVQLDEILPELLSRTIKPFLATLPTSRDTYWKERVWKEVETQKEVIRGKEGDNIETWSETGKVVYYYLDTLLDNLK